MKKPAFENNEYYHIYNRGNNKRNIFLDDFDYSRFFQSMNEFNNIETIGSIFENSFRKELLGSPTSKSNLVDFVGYCLNLNHYHFILKQCIDRGVEKFMQKLGTGYTKYFNKKHDLVGALFQGKYKAIHINSDRHLLHLSAYVNLNNKVHQLGSPTSKLIPVSSYEEYLSGREGFCRKDIILDQFKNVEEYKKFAEDSLIIIQENKDEKKFLLE